MGAIELTVAEQIARDASCAQGEYHARVKAIMPYLDTLKSLYSRRQLEAEIKRLRAILDAAIRILSDDHLPLQSRVNDARSILAK